MIRNEFEQLKTELSNSSSSKSRSIVLRCRMKTRIQPKSEFPNYQFVQISGYMIDIDKETSATGRFDQCARRTHKAHPYLRVAFDSQSSSNSSSSSSKNSSFSAYKLDNSFDPTNKTSYGTNSSSNLSKFDKSVNYSFYNQTTAAANYLFVGFLQTIQRKPFEKLTLFESLQDEYVTLYSLECRIIAVDHRISNVIGFMPKEIINNHVNEFIHKGDQLISKIAHQMSKYFLLRNQNLAFNPSTWFLEPFNCKSLFFF